MWPKYINAQSHGSLASFLEDLPILQKHISFGETIASKSISNL